MSQDITVIVQPQIPVVVTVSQGPAGNRIYTGAGAPSSSVGTVGDIYIDTVSLNVYQRTSGGWGSPIANLGATSGITDVGSILSPQLITTSGGSIAPGTAQRTRVFCQGNGGLAVDPIIPNGSGTRELFLFCTSTSNGIQLDNASNILLYGGQWIGISGSILAMQWDNNSRWVESGRNQILI